MTWKRILNLILSGLGWAKREGLIDKQHGGSINVRTAEEEFSTRTRPPQ